MRGYKRIILLVVLVIVLSFTSTTVSFFREFSYGWGFDSVGIPEEEIWEVAITQHGFPYGWYSIIRFIRGGHLETETFEFHSEVFIVDTVIYIIIYSMVATLFWGYRKSNIPCELVANFFTLSC